MELSPFPPSLPHPPGLPKAARISHLKVLQCQGFYQLCGAHQEDVIYVALPLYHMSGSLLGIVGCLGIGQSPLPNPHSVLCHTFSKHLLWCLPEMPLSPSGRESRAYSPGGGRAYSPGAPGAMEKCHLHRPAD